MKLEQPAPGVGVIATEVDVCGMSAQEWDRLYQAWLAHSVLVVRGQHLEIGQFLDFGRRFGRVKPHRVRKSRHQEYPELTVMGVGTKKADGTKNDSVYNRGVSWHTDGPWDDEPCKATQLYGLEIPSYGGDTLFSNMYMAYDALPDALKQRIAGLDANYVYGGRKRIGVDLLEPEDQARPPTRYALVRVHPETGRKSLYFNPFHIQKIADLPEAESDALIEELTGHLVAPQADYRHKWQKGDLVVWDNRCTIHSATGGYPIEEKRVHWRCTIMDA
ncbi:MAG: Taurine dioxygenase [Betaproteobacteria bacterium]|nr:Taurine dioxygenase [Betaproteobacteria bacterium]